MLQNFEHAKRTHVKRTHVKQAHVQVGLDSYNTFFNLGRLDFRGRPSYHLQLLPMLEASDKYITNNGWPGNHSPTPDAQAAALLKFFIDIWPQQGITANPHDNYSAIITWNQGGPLQTSFEIGLGVTWPTVMNAFNQLGPIRDQLMMIHSQLRTMTPAQYAAAQHWSFYDNQPAYISAKNRATERRVLRDERVLRNAAGQVVKFDRDDMRNTTNLTGVGFYYDPATNMMQPHRGILQVLLAWGVDTIQWFEPCRSSSRPRA